MVNQTNWIWSQTCQVHYLCSKKYPKPNKNQVKIDGGWVVRSHQVFRRTTRYLNINFPIFFFPDKCIFILNQRWRHQSMRFEECGFSDLALIIDARTRSRMPLNLVHFPFSREIYIDFTNKIPGCREYNGAGSTPIVKT